MERGRVMFVATAVIDTDPDSDRAARELAVHGYALRDQFPAVTITWAETGPEVGSLSFQHADVHTVNACLDALADRAEIADCEGPTYYVHAAEMWSPPGTVRRRRRFAADLAATIRRTRPS